MPPAARITDIHVCQAHAPPTPIATGAKTVNIGFKPAARTGDRAACPASAVIGAGSPNVFIEGSMAARLGDSTVPSGMVLTGCYTVNIGSTPEIAAFKQAASSGTPFLDCETCRLQASSESGKK